MYYFGLLFTSSG